MTMFIKLENGQPIGYPLLDQNVRYLFPNIEWPSILTPGFAASIGYGLYEFSQQPEVAKHQKLEEDAPRLGDDGVWYQTWKVVSQTNEEIIQTNQDKAQQVRQQRNYFLTITDWTQIPNSELTPEMVQAYADYRFALRRVTDQPGFPWEVIWPEEPK